MEKIKLKGIAKKLYEVKGVKAGPFSDCLHAKCGKNRLGGGCCVNGVCVDGESYNLMIKYRSLFKKELGLPLKKCFKNDWIKDSEFLGKKFIETKVRNHICVFRSSRGLGCEIARLVLKKKLPRRMIPSGCRLYPITWDKGRLFLEKIRKNCIYSSGGDKIKKTIYDTFKDDLNDIFVFNE